MDFCLYADVYGFSAMVRDDLDAVKGSLSDLTADCIDRVRRFAKTSAFETSVKFFSDNVMIVSKSPDDVTIDTPTELEKFCTLCTDLYAISVYHKMPFRGSIAIGEIIISPDNQFLGRPIIEAVEFEKGIRLPMIFLPEVMIDRVIDGKGTPSANIFREMLFDIPFGQGIVSAAPLVPSEANNLLSFARDNYMKLKKDHKTAKPAQDWYNIMSLTETLIIRMGQ